MPDVMRSKVWRKVWDEWNALPDGETSPVKTIAAKLGMEPATVAAVVYPPGRYGAWSDDQEPMDPKLDPIMERVIMERVSEATRVLANAAFDFVYSHPDIRKSLRESPCATASALILAFDRFCDGGTVRVAAGKVMFMEDDDQGGTP